MKSAFFEEMDETLEQLSKNEEALKTIHHDTEFCYEKEILERTQVSLAAHLFHLEKRQKNRLRQSRKEKISNIAARYQIQ